MTHVTICDKCEAQVSSKDQRLLPAVVTHALDNERDTFFLATAEGDHGRPTYRRLSYQNGCRFC